MSAVTGTDILLGAAELVARLSGPRPPVVIDASVELPSARHDGDYRVSCGRPGWEREHLPGSRHLDLLADFAEPGSPTHFTHPSPGRAAEVLARAGIRPDDEIVAYDRSDGFWSARLWWSLRALGVRARVLDGGLRAWRAAGLAVEAGAGPEVPGTDPAELVLRPRPDVWATRLEVLEVVRGTRDADLVCALGPDQFTGTAPTRYSRRGHIPTSTNLPARGFATPSGTLAAADRIATIAARVTAPDRPVIVYCGGGISASYTALALVVAGYPDIRIYDGSLEEWSADPALPLAT